MKKTLASLVCVFLANIAWGQNPPGVALPQPPNANVSPPACDQPGAVKTICVPQPSTKIKVSIKYSSETEKFCPPGPRFWPFFGQNNSCAGGDCGNAATKRYLVKRIVTEEEPTIKCVPVTVPACETRGGFLHRSQPSLGAPIASPAASVAPPPIETIPVPPVPSKK